MTISTGEVEHLARLAGLALDPGSLPALTSQIRQILDYVSQLEGIREGPTVDCEHPSPQQPLRDDEPCRSDPAIGVHNFAPAFRDGLFLVPRVLGAGAGGKPSPEGKEE